MTNGTGGNKHKLHFGVQEAKVYNGCQMLINARWNICDVKQFGQKQTTVGSSADNNDKWKWSY